MFNPAKPRPPSGPASAFVVPTEIRGARSDIWTEAGRAIELAYCDRARIGLVVRVAVAIAVVVCVAGTLR